MYLILTKRKKLYEILFAHVSGSNIFTNTNRTYHELRFIQYFGKTEFMGQINFIWKRNDFWLSHAGMILPLECSPEINQTDLVHQK